jgi:CDP-6-deoxy-D-xylo-4-hexulose-3-dehydrase
MIKYHLAEDTIDRKDLERLARWLRTTPHLTQGPRVREFEERWSRWLGARYSVFCNSGSSANLMMFYALLLSGRLRNRKAVVPAVGWATSVAPAIQFGFEPLICEADPDTFGLDLNHLERLLRRHRPAAVMLVHVLGVPHKMREMRALRERYGFFLMEDACAAVGAAYRGRHVGTFGDMASFSFYFGHQMSTIEGGMVSTDDRTFADLLRITRSHGWDKDLDARTQRALARRHRIDGFHKPFVFYQPGFNLRSTDLNAYIGLGQLRKLGWIIRSRERNHAIYQRRLGGRFYTQRPVPGSRVCSISFGLLADSVEQRGRIVRALDRHGVETRIFSAGNLGLHPFWVARYGRASLPMADRIHHTGFFLPNNPSLSPRTVEFIADVVEGAA